MVPRFFITAYLLICTLIINFLYFTISVRYAKIISKKVFRLLEARMGIITNALSILLGGFFGALLKSGAVIKRKEIIGISVLILSIVGFMENLFFSSGGAIRARSSLILIFALIIGYFLGETVGIEARLCSLSDGKGRCSRLYLRLGVFRGRRSSDERTYASRHDGRQLSALRKEPC